MKNQAGYTRVAVVLHWVMALMMAINVALGLYFDRLPEDQIRLAIDTHKSIGITVLGLVLLRLLWRMGHPPPPHPDAMPALERWLAHTVHLGLYGLLLAMPLSGWMHDSAWKGAPTHPMTLFNLVPWPRMAWITELDPAVKLHLHGVFGQWHRWLAWGLYALFGLHVLGALKHQWLDRQKMLQRMWF